MAHNYLVTAQAATVVSSSHCGYFNNSDELNTILIKGNNIEIYNISSDDGFQKINELPFYGRIIDSLIFRPPKCETDHLFLLTQSFSFCIIGTDPSTNQIITKASGQLKEENASIKTSSQSLISIDQTQQNVLIHIYKGEILLIQLDEFGKLKQHSAAEKIIIHELEILSLTFLYQKQTLLLPSTSTTSTTQQLSISDQSIIDNDDNNMNIDDNDNDNNDNQSSSTSAKTKASQAVNKLKNKIKTSKVTEKMKSLRKRSKSKDNVESKDNDNNDDDEEKKSSNITSSNNSNRLLLCILYQDYRKGRHLKTYYLNTSIFELEDGPWVTLMVEEGCNKLLPIPSPLYGVLFIGQYSIAYRNGDNCQRVQVPDGDLCCFDMISSKRPKIDIHQDDDDDDDDDDNDIDVDDNNGNNDKNDNNTVNTVDGTRWLIGDGLNRTLNLLVLRHNEKYQVRNLHFNRLGEIVSPCTISYICSGLTFIGSTCGDSQFIEIHNDKNWRKREEEEEEEEEEDITMDDNNNDDDEYIEILEEYTNLGPIVDMVTVDLERQGQCQLVTCSGVGRDGSLRIIKNGIGIEEVAEIEMEGIQGLWGIKENSSSEFDKYLITSFISETRVLAMTEEGLEEMEMNGLNSKIRTVQCSNMNNDDFVQIGESEINLIDLLSFDIKSKWECNKNGFDTNIKINSCSTDKELKLLCALSGGNLVLLEIISNELKCINNNKLEYEISCVSLIKNYGIVGMWKDYSIRILSLSNFNTILKFSLETDIVPRSVLMIDSYLFVGMGDGSLIETKLDIKQNGIKLIKQKKIPLGTQPVRLVPFKCNNISYIFAGCDRPTVIYLLNNRMFYANVNLPEINYMTEFNTEDFPDCLAMSCDGMLMIGQMDNVQKLHITKISLNEQPRRIAYNKDNNCYLLASQTTTNQSSSQTIDTNNNNNFFHPAYNQTIYKLTLRDEQNIEDVLYTKILDPYWNITKIITHTFKCDPHVCYFIITSCLAKPHEKSPSQGKVEIAMVCNDEEKTDDNNNDNNNNNKTQLKIVHNKLFRGDPSCVRGIGDDYLLIGVRSKIQLFRWILTNNSDNNNNNNDDDNYPFELHHLYTIHNNTFVLDIKVHGDFFIVIDLMKSISMFLLQYTAHQQNIKKQQMIDGTLINDSNNKQYKQQQYEAIITEVARDYDPSWMKCGELYNDQYMIGIDSFCNLFILRRNIDSLIEDERGRLDVICRIHWGDDINIINHGSLVMDIPYDIDTSSSSSSSSSSSNNNKKMDIDKSDKSNKSNKSDKTEMDESDDDDEEEKDDEKTNNNNNNINKSKYNVSSLRPSDLRKCVFGTIDGAIGVLISIPYARYDILQKLETSLRKFVQGLGGLDHEEWRKFKNHTEGKPAYGFLDGDLIETFLNLTNQQQHKVANDMKIDTESLIKIVEEMNRLH